MPVPMTDLTTQYSSMKDEIDEAISRVIKSGRYILGPEVEGLEKELADYCGTKYCIGVASGTDALIISALSCGVKPGDEVITTPFTFIATAEAISHCGATPVFVDIDPQTYNINTDQIEKRITKKTKAIIPVHLFGQPAEMDDILKLRQRYNIKVIEDCAQALSAEYKGKKVGSLGDVGCFSFFPAKNLGAFGDGGAIVTNDAQIAEAAKMLRQHGAKASYYHVLTGYTSRLDSIQAAILRVKLKYLDKWSSIRREKSDYYTQLLRGMDGIVPPFQAENRVTSANYYTVRLTHSNIDRGELRKYLASKGIDTAIYYPLSLHLQEVYKNLGYTKGDFPESEVAQEQVLSFPMYPEIESEQIKEVVYNVQEFLGHKVAKQQREVTKL
jgi:dTDP-4-amino-4,6-dideoxygalactose transaminase